MGVGRRGVYLLKSMCNALMIEFALIFLQN